MGKPSKKEKKSKKSKRAKKPQEQSFLSNMADLFLDIHTTSYGLDEMVHDMAAEKPASNPKEKLGVLYRFMEQNQDPSKAQAIAGSILKYKKSANILQKKQAPQEGGMFDSNDISGLEDSLAGYVKSVRERNDGNKAQSLEGVKKHFSPVYIENENLQAHIKSQKQVNTADAFLGLLPTQLVPKMPSFNEKKKKEEY